MDTPVEPTPSIDGRDGELAGATNALVAILRERGSRAVVQIIGPRGGEGATSVALALARAVQSSLSERACVLHFFGAETVASSGASVGPLREYLSDDDRLAIAQGGLDRILQRMSNNCRIFLVDCGPALITPLAGFVADQVDGTILVLEARCTSGADALAAKALIQNGRGRVLGVVLNKRTYRVPRLIAWLLGLASRPRSYPNVASRQ